MKESVQVTVQVTVLANFFIINNLDEILNGLDTFGEHVSGQVREQIKTTVPGIKIKKLIDILFFCSVGKNTSSILSEFGVSKQTKNFTNYIAVLLDNGLLERTIPEKPTSPLQLYRTSLKGKTLLKILSPRIGN